jgi:SAM-dependent methyltransferase
MMPLSILRLGRILIPPRLRPAMKRALRRTPAGFKYREELDYWRDQWRRGLFENSYYRSHMLAMAEENDERFIDQKIIADFGCGPQGTLTWAKSAKARIGIDVLADAYSDFDIRNHDMIYITCTENSIPLPSNYVDVLFTMNAIDHVSHLEHICAEIVRILAPGGSFIGSFNLLEPPTFSEPQTLTEDRIKTVLLRRLRVASYRTAKRSSSGSVYQNFYDGNINPATLDRGDFLWVRAIKP